ncbi:MAG: YgjV family protein [Erysipelotrichaceae bacterium]|nr:YgjV family protein [Erysipelotrichaceae bacterium]
MSTLTIIIGNVLALIANFFATLNGTRKNKKDMILCDIGAASFFTISDIVLKGYSGAVQNVVAVLRNLIALYRPDDKYLGKILIALGVILGIYFNNLGFIGLLPVATCFYYSVCVIDKHCGPRQCKIAFILNTIAFAIYSIVIYSIVGLVLNTFVAVTAIISLKKNPLK